MYTLEKMPRKFVVTIGGKEQELPDIGEDKTPDQVLKFYSDIYPELMNIAMDGPKIDKGVATYTTKPTMGTKG